MNLGSAQSALDKLEAIARRAGPMNAEESRAFGDQVRELRDLLVAKTIRRERLRFKAKGGACASCNPSTEHEFASLRVLLRKAPEFQFPAENLDRLEQQFRNRWGGSLPVPRQIDQNEDGSLSIFWGTEGEGLTVMCRKDGIASLIGGAKGAVRKGMHNDVLDALYFHVREQTISHLAV